MGVRIFLNNLAPNRHNPRSEMIVRAMRDVGIDATGIRFEFENFDLAPDLRIYIENLRQRPLR